MRASTSERRARNVVVLVVVTVALPSVALTALGIAAIENEETAARKRIEYAFTPVLAKMAERFNLRMDRLLAESEAPLTVLAEWSRGETTDFATFEKFAADAPFALNYFVIDDDGDVLYPPRGDDPPGYWSRQVDPNPKTDPVGNWSARIGPDEDCMKDASCDCARYVEVADLGCACGASLAVALCESERDRRPATVPECVAPNAVIERILATAANRQAPNYDSLVLAVAQDLAAPTNSLPDTVSDVASWWFRARVLESHDTDAIAAGGMLRAINQRRPLFDLLQSLNRPREGRPMVWSWSVNGLRRVLISTMVDDRLVGFELSPDRMRQYVEAGLSDMELDHKVVVYLVPIESPEVQRKDFKEFEQHVAAWALLRKTQLAWNMVILLEDEAELLELVTSRSRLYMWALVMICVALVGGIAFTLHAVIREARESRLKTDFVSSVSHDLRTPLTSIRMFTESLLLGRYESDEEVKESLTVIAMETERLSRLTERILDFSRMEAGKKAYVFEKNRVADLVSHAVSACRPMIDQHEFEVRTNIPDDLPAVRCDRDAIIEALINLVTNAIKYSPDHRTIDIVGELFDDHVAISVHDQGIGIARTDLGRVFDKFYRVDCRRTTEVGGSGLGLSLVRHIIDAHGGELEVDSTPGRGSTFTITLSADA